MLVVNMEPTWSHVGPQKIDLEPGLGRQNLHKMGANLRFKKSFFEAQVGFHFWEGSWRPLGATKHFLEDQETPQNPLKNEIS